MPHRTALPGTVTSFNILPPAQLNRTPQIKGSNDGLKYKPLDTQIWARRNQDGNSALTRINITTGASQDLRLRECPPPSGQTTTHVVFVNDQAFLSASHPKLNAQGQNIYPSIVKATIVGNKIFVARVLLGNATLTDVTTGNPVSVTAI